MRKVAGARHALEEGGDGHGLDADHVGRRRHREEPLRVAARRRVASPLGVYHRHALMETREPEPEPQHATECSGGSATVVTYGTYYLPLWRRPA